MRRLGSLVMAAGDTTKLPAGGALAVDRVAFSDRVTAELQAHPLVTLARGEVDGLPPEDWDSVIVATDRKNVEPGKSRSVREDHGGSRTRQKKKEIRDCQIEYTDRHDSDK